MNDLIIKGQVEVSSNFEDLKKSLELNIKEKYSIAVTDENVKEAKSVMAQINKDKKEIADKWKAKKAELEAPIKELDSKVKELLGLYDNARMVISNQVETFEAGKRELAVKLCKDYASDLLDSKNLKENCTLDFRIFDGFNNLTYVSEKGVLTAIAKQAVENEVSKYELEILRKKQEEAERILREEQIKKEAIERFKQEQEMIKQQREVISEAQAKEYPEVREENSTLSKMEIVKENNTQENNNQEFLNGVRKTYKVTMEVMVITDKGQSGVIDYLRPRIEWNLWNKINKTITEA